MLGSVEVSWVAAASQNPLESPRSTSQPTGTVYSPVLPPPTVQCHTGDNQTLGMKPISEVPQKCQATSHTVAQVPPSTC